MVSVLNPRTPKNPFKAGLRVIDLELHSQGFSLQDVESLIITCPFGAEGAEQTERNGMLVVMGKSSKKKSFVQAQQPAA